MGHDGYTGEGMTTSTIRRFLLLDAKRSLFNRLRSITWFNAGEPYKLGQMRQETFEDYRIRAEEILKLLPRNGAR